MRDDIVILNGFDRCGSSAISRTLVQHPQVELVFQPFNSGSVREKLNIVWTDDVVTASDLNFFSELNQGRLWREYIVSHWFEEYSSVKQIRPSTVTLIKTNINHMMIQWAQDRFPNVKFWGIWRDPYDILASLLRNDFYDSWFKHAELDLKKSVNKHLHSFPAGYGELCDLTKSRPARSMAYIIGVRSYYYFSHLPNNRILSYEGFVQNPKKELAKFLREFDLVDFSWSQETRSDLNVTGANWTPSTNHRQHIPTEDQEFIAQTFKPLLALMQCRFGPGPWTSNLASDNVA